MLLAYPVWMMRRRTSALHGAHRRDSESLPQRPAQLCGPRTDAEVLTRNAVASAVHLDVGSIPTETGGYIGVPLLILMRDSCLVLSSQSPHAADGDPPRRCCAPLTRPAPGRRRSSDRHPASLPAAGPPPICSTTSCRAGSPSKWTPSSQHSLHSDWTICDELLREATSTPLPAMATLVLRRRNPRRVDTHPTAAVALYRLGDRTAGTAPATGLPSNVLRAIPAGDPVTITYPYSTFLEPTPMLWQAEDGFDFRLLGGYAYHPDASGHTFDAGRHESHPACNSSSPTRVGDLPVSEISSGLRCRSAPSW